MAQILVVDDEPASRELLVTLLGYHGHRVLAACDGAEGLTCARAAPPDLIITDILMPELDGYALATRVRADPALAHIPIIFSTAIDLGAEVHQLAAAAGVAQIVLKPTEPETLLAAVLAALASPAPVALSAPTAALDHAYLRQLTSILYRHVEALKAELQARAQVEAQLQNELAERTKVEDEMRRLNAALTRSQAQLASMIDSAMDAIITVNDDQHITLWNTAAERMFGCLAAIARGQRLDRFIPARYRVEHHDHIRAFGRTGTTARAMGALRSLMALRADGTEFPIEASISQVTITEQTLYTVILRDITVRVQAETVLRASEERFAKAFHSSPVAMVISTVADGRILDVNDGFLQLFGSARTALLGQTSLLLDMWADPNDRARAIALLRQHGVVRDLEVTICTTDGATRAVLLSADTLQLGGEPCIITSLYDISTRKQAEVALSAAWTAELTARQLAETFQIASQALAATLDQSTILTTLLEQLAQLVPYDRAQVLLLDGDGHLSMHAERGANRETNAVQTRTRTVDPAANPLFRALIARQQSLLVADTRQHPQWQDAPGMEQVVSWCGVPLCAGGELIGLCSIEQMVAGFFTGDQVRHAEVLAAQAAVALQNARRFGAVRQGHARLQALSQRLVTIQEDERRHIARELHDEIGQALTGLRLTLELMGRLPPDGQAVRLAEAHTAVQELIARVRSLSLDLRPAMLDDLGLLAALLWHIRRYTEQTGITVDCQHRGLEQRLPTAVETVAYRVVQEALTNVARHAGVTTVDVRLLATPAQLSLRIADMGRGFDPAAALRSLRSSGLLGMQERVVLLGGTLSITAAPGAGTQILADLPLHMDADVEEHDGDDRPRG